MVSDPKVFEYGPASGHPGWFTWDLTDTTRFNSQVMGSLLVRREDGGRCRLRMQTARKHSNLADVVHGAITLSLIDVSLFAAVRILLAGDGDAGHSVTLEVSSQFIGAGQIGMPLDAVVEVLRETRRLVFLRGTVVQGENDAELIASFSGIVRKSSPK